MTASYLSECDPLWHSYVYLMLMSLLVACFVRLVSNAVSRTKCIALSLVTFCDFYGSKLDRSGWRGFAALTGRSARRWCRQMPGTVQARAREALLSSASLSIWLNETTIKKKTDK